MPSSILNSDDGVISGTSGLKSSGGDDGVLKIQNNGTDAVTVADDGDVTLAADLSVTGNLLFNSGFGSAGTAYGCRAWVNFDGTGTVAIRESGNVSSITDNGTGDYTVNFAQAMPDANYSGIVTGTLSDSGMTSSSTPFTCRSFATSSMRATGAGTGNVGLDMPRMCVAIFR